MSAVVAAAAKTVAYACRRCRYGISVGLPWHRLPRCPMCGHRDWQVDARHAARND